MTKHLFTTFTLQFFLAVGISLAQTEYPVATPTDNPDVVISPFEGERRLDVAGLDPGSLAEDPIAKKIFRIPYSNPTQRYYDDNPITAPIEEEVPSISTSSQQEVIPPPPVTGGPSKPPAPRSSPQPKGSTSTSWVPISSEVPSDLRDFIYAFNQNSSVNDSSALLPFYANPVRSYFGKSNFSHSAIRADRASYIKKWPQRNYVLDGAPVLLTQEGNVYEVLTRVRFAVRNGAKGLSGAVSHNYQIRRGAKRYEILSIREARASAAPANIQKQDYEQKVAKSPMGSGSGSGGHSNHSHGTMYSKFEIEQVNLFLDAFAASGEINEPGAQLDFLHPNINNFFGMKNPSMNSLLKNRRDFINDWPSRRYWLTEKPVITPLSSGSWDVLAKTGWEVRKGSNKKGGVSVNRMRITHTPAGLKILSVGN